MSEKVLKILAESAVTLPLTKLPLNGDVLKAIHFEKEIQKTSKSNAIKIVAKQISDLWNRTMIPTVTERRIQQQASSLYERHVTLRQNDKNNKLFKVIFNFCMSLRL